MNTGDAVSEIEEVNSLNDDKSEVKSEIDEVDDFDLNFE